MSPCWRLMAVGVALLAAVPSAALTLLSAPEAEAESRERGASTARAAAGERVVGRSRPATVRARRASSWPSEGRATPDSPPATTAPASAESESPTGPIELAAAGIALDPLAPGEPDQQLAIQQPDAGLLPYFLESSGWFGQGFVDSLGSQRGSVAVGADRVLVLSDVADKVFIYDTRTLAAQGSFATGFEWSMNVAFYRGEVYVLGDVRDPVVGVFQRVSVVKVFNLAGQLQREFMLRPPYRPVGLTYTGLDLAWGEIWLATSSSASGGDLGGQEVAVFDATTGAFKGAVRQPLGDKGESDPNRYWWDFALSPELRGGISDRRFFGRGAEPLAAFGIDHAVACTGRVLFGCSAQNQRGTDAVWGMRWFLELNSPVISNYDRKVTEYSIDRRRAVSQPALGLALDYPGYYLSLRRSWRPNQAVQNTALTLTDVVYSHRKARIDWDGPLTKSDWVRGTHALPYVVSDADIFVIGARGERWYEPARGFQKIELWIDGQLKETKTAPAGSFDNIDTTQYANRPEGTQPAHTIELRAYLEGGRVVSATNADLRIDNQAPGGTVIAPGPYARQTVTVTGTAIDTHSGPESWQLQAQPAGGSWQNLCPPDSEPDALAAYSCNWNTTLGQDGTYKLRARIIDRSVNDGNSAYSPETEIVVDNTPPSLSDVAPALGSPYSAFVEANVSPVHIRHEDVTSGIERTELEINTAGDGTETGVWEPARANPATAPGEDWIVWDTTEITDGTHMVRATTSDRAGNRRQTRYQVAFAARRSCPRQDKDAPRRCYGGVVVGNLQRHPLDYDRNAYVSTGVQAYIDTPNKIPGGAGFSASGVSVLGPLEYSTVETGIINNNCRGDDSGPAEPLPEDRGRNHWWAYAYHILGGGYAGTSNPCLFRTYDGTRRKYKVVIRGRNALAIISGRVRTVSEAYGTCKRDCFTDRPSVGSTVFGETNRYKREVAGYFDHAAYKAKNGGWTPASSGEWRRADQGVGYRSILHQGNPGFFCVDGPDGGGCTPPTP